MINLRQEGMIDAAQIMSLVIGYENLIENRQQSRSNDVRAANDQQASYILSKIQELFERQNKQLESIQSDIALIKRALYL